MSKPAGDSHSFEWGFNDLWSHSDTPLIGVTLANGGRCELMLSAKALSNSMRFCYSNICGLRMSKPAGDFHSFEWGFNDLWSHSEQARIRVTLANGEG
jgi:hypothetical protein